LSRFRHLKKEFFLQGVHKKAYFSIGTILLAITTGLLLLPDNTSDATRFAVKAENIADCQTPYLTQRNEDAAVYDQNIIQGNSLAPVCSPENARIRTFANIEDDYQEQRPEAQSITGKEIVEYIVQKGDTFQSIADKYDIKPQTIYWANDLSAKSAIKEGMSLIILPVDGLVYTVQNGDSLDKIAKIYQSGKDKIIAFNELDSEKLYPGDILILPNAKMPAKAPTYSAQGQYADNIVPDSYFICPIPRVSGVCKKTQGLHFRNAVDLAPGMGSCGQPVFAAASGKVLKVRTSGYNGGFGSYVKIQHPSGLTTLYAHMGRVNVKEGEDVVTGQTIGLIGNTGRTIGVTGCHVHFEVGSISGAAPRNPLR